MKRLMALLLTGVMLAGALLGVSLPNFCLALLMVLLFAVKLNWLPAMGIGSLAHYILPALAGSFGGIALMARQTRSSMLEVIRADYVTTARAKGVKEFVVIYGHALRNALIPVITLVGTQFGVMLGEKGHSQSLPKKQGQLYNKHQSGGTG